MELFSFSILFILFVSLSVYFIRKSHNNLVQPHAFYTAKQAVMLLFIPLMQFYCTDMFVDRRGVVFFNALIGLSYLSFSAGFLVNKQKVARILNQLIRKFNITKVPHAVLSIHVILMVSAATLFYVILAEKSGFGLLAWLQDPRTGYQFYRRGTGHLYVVSIATLSFAYLYILFFWVNNNRKLIAVTTAFVFLLYFYASKMTILLTIFEAIVFYNFFLRKIKTRQAIVMFCMLLLSFTMLFWSYGSRKDPTHLSIRILKYADYYTNGRRFFADFKDEFQHVYGKEYFDSLWGYVPRAFYPKKPYSYGVIRYVTEHYYPGAGASGHTPAFGGPVEEYLNFGLIGIISVGFVRGYILSLFYTYFLRYRNFVGFVLLSNAMGFQIFPIVERPPYKVLWYTMNVLLLFHKQLIKRVVRINQEHLCWDG